MNDASVEVEPRPAFQTNTINKFHIQNFKITNKKKKKKKKKKNKKKKKKKKKKKNFHKWYSDLKLFLDSEELSDYILKNIKDINSNKNHLKCESVIRIIILK